MEITAYEAQRATLVALLLASGLLAGELWSIRSEFADGGILDPRLSFRGHRKPWRARVSRRIPELSVALTVLLAGSLAAWESPAARAAGGFGSLATASILYVTFGPGRDGSDDMTWIVAFMAGAALAVNRDWATQAALVGIAGTAMIAYSVAGFAKLAGRRWRSGSALESILKTNTYGSASAGRLISKHRTFGRLAGYTVIAVELLVPCSVLVGGWVLVSALALAFIFHLGVGATMGLNRFTLAFAATYPSLIWLSGNLA